MYVCIYLCTGFEPQEPGLFQIANNSNPPPQLPMEPDSPPHQKKLKLMNKPSFPDNHQECITFDDLIDHCCLKQHLLESRVTQEHLQDISILLDRWREFARVAGLTDPDIVAIECDERYQSDQRYKALRLWHQKNAFLATYSELIRIMLKIQKADIAEQVCKLVNEMDENSTVAGKS